MTTNEPEPLKLAYFTGPVYDGRPEWVRVAGDGRLAPLAAVQALWEDPDDARLVVVRFLSDLCDSKGRCLVSVGAVRSALPDRGE